MIRVQNVYFVFLNLYVVVKSMTKSKQDASCKLTVDVEVNLNLTTLSDSIRWSSTVRQRKMGSRL